jgi:cytochrome c biogenesis factor
LRPLRLLQNRNFVLLIILHHGVVLLIRWQDLRRAHQPSCNGLAALLMLAAKASLNPLVAYLLAAEAAVAYPALALALASPLVAVAVRKRRG